MQYMLLIYSNPNRGNNDAEMQAYFDFTADMRQRGLYVAGEALQPATATTSIRTANGAKGVVTDGPFAETKEVLGGFYILDCKDLDEAMEQARRINTIDDSTVEIRPIWVFA
ncbi:MAG: YciI family protein [Chloroflexi bacterium]|nr:YciI family protein [Chloroflexota bacterium]